eukprot:12894091-Prorocentrum_lima.AAC.1
MLKHVGQAASIPLGVVGRNVLVEGAALASLRHVLSCSSPSPSLTLEWATVVHRSVGLPHNWFKPYRFHALKMFNIPLRFRPCMALHEVAAFHTSGKSLLTLLSTGSSPYQSG